MPKNKQYALKEKEMKLLLSLVHSTSKQSRKIFDKHDNTLTNKSLRERAEIILTSKSSLGRLLQKLRNKDLLKKVITVTGEEREMLNPSFYCCREGMEKRFMQAMYEQASHDKACEWATLCQHHYLLIDYSDLEPKESIDEDTGEITTCFTLLRELDHHEVLQWKFDRQSYTSTDRTKRYDRSLF